MCVGGGKSVFLAQSQQLGIRNTCGGWRGGGAVPEGSTGNSGALWGWGWDQVLPFSLPQVGPKGGRSCLGEKPWLEVEPELREMPSPHARPGQVRDGVWGVAVALLPLGSLHV